MFSAKYNYRKFVIFAVMDITEKKNVRVAILDMYEGVANQGMRCLREILNQYGEASDLDLQWDEFEVRLQKMVPDLSYDIYISSGGPGSPLIVRVANGNTSILAGLTRLKNGITTKRTCRKNMFSLSAILTSWLAAIISWPQSVNENLRHSVCFLCTYCPELLMSLCLKD